MKKIRVGVIGLGFGRRVHIPALRMDSRFEIKGIWSRDKKKTRRVAAEEKISKVYSTWAQMLSDPSLDAFFVAVAPPVQALIALKALGNRKPLFLEKPLSANVGKARKIRAAAKLARVPVMMDFEFPELSTWRRANSILESGRLGTIRQALVLWKIPMPPAHLLKPSWKDHTSRGGGVLYNFGSHVFNYVEWLLGPIVKINCSGHSSVVLHMQMKNKSAVSVVITRQTRNRRHQLTFIGDKGSLQLENTTSDHVFGFQIQTSPGKIIETEKKIAGISDGRIQAVSRLVHKFGDWIKMGRKENPSLGAGVRVEELMDTARRSLRTGKWVNV